MGSPEPPPRRPPSEARRRVLLGKNRVHGSLLGRAPRSDGHEELMAIGRHNHERLTKSTDKLYKVGDTIAGFPRTLSAFKPPSFASAIFTAQAEHEIEN